MKIQKPDPKSPPFLYRLASGREIHHPSLAQPFVLSKEAWMLAIIIFQFNQPLPIQLFVHQKTHFCTGFDQKSRSPRKVVWGFLKAGKSTLLGKELIVWLGQGWWEVGSRYASVALPFSACNSKRKKQDDIGDGVRPLRRIFWIRTKEEGQGMLSIDYCYVLPFVAYLKDEGGWNYTTLLPLLTISHLYVIYFRHCLFGFQIGIWFLLVCLVSIMGKSENAFAGKNRGTPPTQNNPSKDNTAAPKASAAGKGKQKVKEDDFDEK